jgi:nitrate reductase gamma subunit
MAEVELRNLLPVALVDAGAVAVVIVVIIGLVYKLGLWRRVLPPRLFSEATHAIGTRGMVQSAFGELANRVILQRNVIVDSPWRFVAHHMVFWGFVASAVATSLVYVYAPDARPRALLEPAKIAGNIGAILLLVGTTYILGRLWVRPEYRRERRRGDAVFLLALFATALTGVVTEWARIATIRELAYGAYVTHMVSVIALLATAPFTHFMHAITTPLLRWTDRLHLSVLQTKTARDLKEAAMLDQIAGVYASPPRDQERPESATEHA